MTSTTPTETEPAMASPLKPLPPIVLGSSSPRRQQLLTTLGIEFMALAPDLDEDGVFNEAPYNGTLPSPDEQVKVLAKRKAEAVAAQLRLLNTSTKEGKAANPRPLGLNTPIIIASDTTVALNGKSLGKPQNKADALTMLQELQGTRHSVWSAIALHHGETMICHALETHVWMKPTDEETLKQYIATGEPMDKAGAYGIQGIGGMLVHRIEGCYFNVMGMSVSLLHDMVKELGYKLF